MKVSVYAAVYNIGTLLYRLYDSIKQQTYTDWELILYNDSTDTKTEEIIKELCNKDSRVKGIYPDKHSGVIGYTKLQACKHCTGEIILEMDHDDEIVPDCIQTLVDAFHTYPDASFAYSDWMEIESETVDGYQSYKDHWGMGQGASYYQYFTNHWATVLGCSNTVSESFTHIVGVPNHLKAWKKEAYWKAGGHDPELIRCDDYDLVIRTFLQGRFIRIPRMMYKQWIRKDDKGQRISGTDAKLDAYGRPISTNYRHQIQKLCPLVFSKYIGDIQRKIKEYGSDRMVLDYKHRLPYWKYSEHVMPYNYIYQPNKSLVSVIIPTMDRTKQLTIALKSVLNQTYTNLEIIIVGDKCPTLSDTMQNYTDKRIKWWNLDTNNGGGGSDPRNYAIKMISTGDYIAYLDDDMEWEPSHIESLMNALKEQNASYAFSSMNFGGKILKCTKPRKFRIDTSCILHKRELFEIYGYWRVPGKVGYAIDWDLVNRWHTEPYAITEQATMIYSPDQVKNREGFHNRIWNLYNDQD